MGQNDNNQPDLNKKSVQLQKLKELLEIAKKDVKEKEKQFEAMKQKYQKESW